MPVGIKSSGGGTTTLVAESSATNYTATLPANSGTIITTNSTAAITPTQLNTQAQYTGFKNRIINGAMVIDQRNGGASITPTDGQYSLDRYKIRVSQASKLTVQQNAGSVTPPAGFTNYLGVTSSSAYSIVSGDYFLIVQDIEGFNTADLNWGSANAKTITLSFWVRSSLTGTFSGAVRNSAANRSYVFSYTINSANTWEYETITIPGDTTGTWVGATNGIGISVILNLASGSTYSTTAGSWAASNYTGATGSTSVVGTNGATFYVTGLQFEVGSTATSFDYRPYGTELALCQRYFFKPQDLSVSNVIYGATYGSSGMVPINYPVTMRARPTNTQTANATVYAPYGTTEICVVNIASTTPSVSAFTASAEL